VEKSLFEQQFHLKTLVQLLELHKRRNEFKQNGKTKFSSKTSSMI